MPLRIFKQFTVSTIDRVESYCIRFAIICNDGHNSKIIIILTHSLMLIYSVFCTKQDVQYLSGIIDGFLFFFSVYTNDIIWWTAKNYRVRQLFSHIPYNRFKTIRREFNYLLWIVFDRLSIIYNKNVIDYY